MDISLIMVPYEIGVELAGAGKGPGLLVERGALDRLHASGANVKLKATMAHDLYQNELQAVVDVNGDLARRVRAAKDADRLPVVLAGTCDTALGVLTGVGPEQVGVIWFDAHGDFNTPETTQSNFFGGMPLAIATGHGHRDLWRDLGNQWYVGERSTLLVAVRDLDVLEKELLDSTDVTVVTADALRGKLAAALTPILDALANRVNAIYLHLDIDALDPEYAPGVDYRTPDGLTLAEMQQAIILIAERFTIAAVALTAFNPEKDEADRTLESGLTLLETIVQTVKR